MRSQLTPHAAANNSSVPYILKLTTLLMLRTYGHQRDNEAGLCCLPMERLAASPHAVTAYVAMEPTLQRKLLLLAKLGHSARQWRSRTLAVSELIRRKSQQSAKPSQPTQRLITPAPAMRKEGTAALIPILIKKPKRRRTLTISTFPKQAHKHPPPSATQKYQNLKIFEHTCTLLVPACAGPLRLPVNVASVLLYLLRLFLHVSGSIIEATFSPGLGLQGLANNIQIWEGLNTLSAITSYSLSPGALELSLFRVLLLFRPDVVSCSVYFTALSLSLLRLTRFEGRVFHSLTLR